MQPVLFKCVYFFTIALSRPLRNSFRGPPFVKLCNGSAAHGSRRLVNVRRRLLTRGAHSQIARQMKKPANSPPSEKARPQLTHYAIYAPHCAKHCTKRCTKHCAQPPATTFCLNIVLCRARYATHYMRRYVTHYVAARLTCGGLSRSRISPLSRQELHQTSPFGHDIKYRTGLDAASAVSEFLPFLFVTRLRNLELLVEPECQAMLGNVRECEGMSDTLCSAERLAPFLFSAHRSVHRVT